MVSFGRSDAATASDQMQLTATDSISILQIQCYVCRIHSCAGANRVSRLTNLAWDDFRLVKVIAEAKGLTGAAERLGVNHSTIFRRLGQMEDGLGIKLFERHRSGYVLTPAGEEMAALAETMEENVEHVRAQARRARTVSPAGELRDHHQRHACWCTC